MLLGSLQAIAPCDMPRQASCGVWYFHKKGGTYKSGSFKGMDLACGDKDRDVFAGLLLRSVVDADGKLTEGPCLVVDKILELNGRLTDLDISGRCVPQPVNSIMIITAGTTIVATIITISLFLLFLLLL